MISTLIPSIFLNKDCTDQLYSREGRTRERHEVSFNFDGVLLRFVLRKAKLDLPLAETIYICLEKTNLLSIWIPILYLEFLPEFLRPDYRISEEDF